MKKIEITKLLYKRNPKANLKFIRCGVAYYITNLDIDGNIKEVEFQIPVDDMGTADFLPEMDSKFLNRWMILNEGNEGND